MGMFDHKKKIAIGMVQPTPLPGSFHHNGESIGQILDYVLNEASVLDRYGFDGYILQNMGDNPIKQHANPETIGYMTYLANELKRAFPKLIQGILVNWDGVASLAVADAVGSDFARIEHAYIGAELTTAGIIEGQCVEVTAFKKKIGTPIPVYVDVYEPHAVQIKEKPIGAAAFEAVYEAMADGLFLSGHGYQHSIEMAKEARKTVGNTPIILGGGSTGDNVFELLQYFDGVCVGAWIKNGNLSNPVDPERAKRFMDEVERARN